MSAELNFRFSFIETIVRNGDRAWDKRIERCKETTTHMKTTFKIHFQRDLS